MMVGWTSGGTIGALVRPYGPIGRNRLIRS